MESLEEVWAMRVAVVVDGRRLEVPYDEAFACSHVAQLEALERGGQPTLGSALPPDEETPCEHFWVVRDGEVVDPMGWRNHARLRDVPLDEEWALEIRDYVLTYGEEA